MASFDQQIRQLVKDLHSLNELGRAESRRFDAVFRKVVDDVLALVSFKDKHKIRISISTSQFPPLVINCYCKHPKKDFVVDQPSIHQLAQSDPHIQHTSRFHQLLRALSNTTAEGGRPRRVKQEYKDVVDHLSRYLEQLSALYDSSQSQLADFLSRCLTHEYALAYNLNRKVEETTDETEQLISALDGLVTRTQAMEDNDSIFDYKPSSHSNESSELLNFTSSDETLNQTYEAILHLALLKPASSFYGSVSSLARVILQILEKYHGVELMEIEEYQDREGIRQLMYEFLLGSEDYAGIVPHYFLARAESILDSNAVSDESFGAEPTNAKEDFDEAPTSFMETSIAESYSREELIELLANLNTVVALLNEYDLQFHPQFPKIFRAFLNLVYDDLNDLASAKDYEYVETISDLVRQISDYEVNVDGLDGDIIRGIIDHLHFMQGFLTSGYDDSTLLMRSATRVFFSEFEITKRVFRDWNLKTVSVVHLETILNQNSPSKNGVTTRDVFSTWYDKYMKLSQLSSQADRYSAKKLIARILKDLWIPKLIHFGDLEYQSQKFVLDRRFRSWNSKSAKWKRAQSSSEAFYTRNLLSATLNQMKQRISKLRLDNKNAATIHDKVRKKTDGIIARNTIHQWQTMLNKKFSATDEKRSSSKDWSLSEKLAALGKIESRYSLGKHFKNWQKQMTLRSRLEQSAQLSSKLRRRFFLGVWRRAFAMNKLLEKWQIKQDDNVTKAIFKHWKDSWVQNEKASEYQRKACLSAALKKWNLEHKRKSACLDSSLKLSTIKNWKLKALSGEFRNKLKRRHLRTYFNVWRTKRNNMSENEAVSTSFGNDKLRSAMFALWKSRIMLHRELNVVAKLNSGRSHFHHWRNKYLTHLAVQERAIAFKKEGRSLNEKALLQFFIKHWKEKVVSRFEDYSNGVIFSFNQSVRRKGTLKVFLKSWKRKYAETNSKQKRLEFLSNQYNRANPALATIVRHWKEKTYRLFEYEQAGLDFYRAMLHKKFMVVWYEKLIVKVNYLDELVEEVLSQKSYATTLEYLQKWNLKYVKTYKRNLQTCEMFQDKWNTAKARSLFQVWRHKAFHKDTSQQEEEAEDFAEANTSMFYSSLSPLAKKRGSFFEGHSYLHTPVKKHVANAPFTPSSRIRRTSPTRLQDTNQKMTLDKIDALINHYRKVKEPTNRKTTRVQSNILRLQDISTVRLSPPRQNARYSSLPSKPPAPKFERVLDTSPKATSSPFEPNGYQKLPSPLPSADIDASVLSTAKKLKRFKPLCC
ncbi:hypothetical protein CXQ85_000949 [Candidozyma haemuli]|uniref:Sfi1 spindle body domain-containing protein n=1 Tax=Candidozyma haemuli TaxID=45357 RepID=A0A2V1AM96_9ASCO|nr:hypothetical protein CXQ85_000949 [[Candida] haemuloni]PVH18666.1 hypothetical protein CXQ85_000949 [[Candida] haemuloni]